jgi:hypothetical protein
VNPKEECYINNINLFKETPSICKDAYLMLAFSLSDKHNVPYHLWVLVMCITGVAQHSTALACETLHDNANRSYL